MFFDGLQDKHNNFYINGFFFFYLIIEMQVSSKSHVWILRTGCFCFLVLWFSSALNFVILPAAA
jgi:hypothetical protein